MTEPREESGTDVEQALAAYLAAQRMTRRQLLERIAAVGAAAALAPVIAACASGPMADAERAAGSSTGTGAQAVPAVEALPPVPPLPASSITAAPVQAAAASSHVIARILARIVSRG
jgi:hypothetical protein